MHMPRHNSRNVLALYITLCMVLVFVSPPATANESKVQTQSQLQDRVSDNKPAVHRFIKDKPILVWTIKSGRLQDIPAAIRQHLGSVDQTQYTDEYITSNIGAAIALQMDTDKPDFYVIGKGTFTQKYQEVPLESIGTKNASLLKQLKNVPGIVELMESGNPSITAALKSTPVEMIKLSDIGYPATETVVINAPWGEQTKPAGSDGYLVFDTSKNQYYLVNQGDNGNPLSYVPVP